MATYDDDDDNDDDDDFVDDDDDDDEDTVIFGNIKRFQLSVFVNLVIPHLEMSCSE